MKECPNCKKVYSDDLFFCFDDGSPLRNIVERSDPNALTEAAHDVISSLRTEVLPNPIPTPKTAVVQQPDPAQPRVPSKLPYVAIILLVLTCIGLAATLIVLNLDRFTTQQKTNETVVNNNNNKNITTAMQTVTSTPYVANTANAATTSGSKQVENQITNFDPGGKWKGEWSTASGTLLVFDLTLTLNGNDLDGQVKWTLRRTVRPDKADKVGLSAIEFVRGKYDPTTGDINLTGYGKDDPNNVLVMTDVYRLKISSDGRRLTGAARNGGKWNGRVNLSR